MIPFTPHKRFISWLSEGESSLSSSTSSSSPLQIELKRFGKYFALNNVEEDCRNRMVDDVRDAITRYSYSFKLYYLIQ